MTVARFFTDGIEVSSRPTLTSPKLFGEYLAMEALTGTRLLIATGAAATDVEQLPPLIRSLIERASEVLVMTPILTSRLRWLVSDTDRGRHEADERLAAVLSDVESIAPQSVTAAAIGDETPLTAFDDAVRRFHPDHILVALRAADRAAWQERQLADRVLERFQIPMTIFQLDSTGQVPAPRRP
jgi:hypothetical protein